MNQVDLIMDRYRQLRFSREDVKKFLFKYAGRKILIIENLRIRGIGIYFKLTDETLAKIETGELDLTKIETVNKCLHEDGENIHFFLVIADGVKTILKGLRISIKDAKTVSWFSPDMKQFFIRRELCQSQL